MRIAIDLQGAQTAGSRDRGIGRYTMALTKAFVQQAAPRHEVWIAANANLGNVELIRGDFEGLVPQERIVSFAVPQHTAALEANRHLTRAGELLRENFLRDLNADIVWCSSLFEGAGDSAIASVHLLPGKTFQAITLYDLIPLSYKKLLTNPRIRTWYYQKLSHLQSADILLSISEYSRIEAIRMLNIEPDRITNISSAVDERFHLLGDEKCNLWRESLQHSFNLGQLFVLCVGGDDPRKNVALLIRAFAQLPKNIRRQYKLVLAYKISSDTEAAMRSLAKKQGLGTKNIIFTNYVSDEQLVALYNLCSLFVFPSLQEGFGLPVLEAMACGAPVLAANATSLPEVIGREDMLFPPNDAEVLARKMTAVLSDPVLAQNYSRHGLERLQTFSWQASARRALEVFESQVIDRQEAQTARIINRTNARPKLAYVSPLPPERTGIANYSAELLPALERYYDIEVVVDQATITDPWISANYPVRNAAWLRAHAQYFDRVLYQFGNSHFHNYQVSLMADIPGTVMMHDSFIGDLSAWRAVQTGDPQGYRQRLYYAHGYKALLDDKNQGRNWTREYYPSNWDVFEQAVGIIVHSQYAINQIKYFHGDKVALKTRKITFPKRQRVQSRDVWRQSLGFRSEDFVVCSFGIVAPTKLNHRLLTAWLASSLANDVHCHLVFVGDSDGNDYVKSLRATIQNSHLADRVQITGYIDDERFHGWLDVADLAVQLRTQSRGETSAAIFDCMGHGVPQIINAHATSAELDPEAVFFLSDLFDDADLTCALEYLYNNPKKRQLLADRSQQIIHQYHHPIVVAGQYRDAIEHFSSQHPLAREQELSRQIVSLGQFDDKQWWEIAAAMHNNRRPYARHTLFIDVTAVVRNNIKTGIERVTRNIAGELMRTGNHDLRVELVHFYQGRYVYAHTHACRLLDVEDLDLPEKVIEVSPEDIFFGLDSATDIVPNNRALFQAWRDQGALVYFFLYDLLPVFKPVVSPYGESQVFKAWLDCLTSCADGVICISKTVAQEFLNWLNMSDHERNRPLRIGYLHLGAQLDEIQSMPLTPDTSMSEDIETAIARMRVAPSLLMMGMIEPRNGHRLALKACERLWRAGHDLNLIIVGKLGWSMDAFAEQLRSHPEQGKRLFWLTGISDRELTALYGIATVLLAASEGEGFGLPLIEAAMHGIPIIARDLPVFREVAGPHAYYFADDGSAEGLIQAILDWLALSHAGKAPSSKQMPYLTWQESAKTVQAMLIDAEHPHWLYRWQSSRCSER
jgi:glycosyltransferase involved in cell wall biosynthesis